MRYFPVPFKVVLCWADERITQCNLRALLKTIHIDAKIEYAFFIGILNKSQQTYIILPGVSKLMVGLGKLRGLRK
jgi:hypothetical protein